jgi:hypothetical protein
MPRELSKVCDFDALINIGEVRFLQVIGDLEIDGAWGSYPTTPDHTIASGLPPTRKVGCGSLISTNGLGCTAVRLVRKQGVAGSSPAAFTNLFVPRRCQRGGE